MNVCTSDQMKFLNQLMCGLGSFLRVSGLFDSSFHVLLKMFSGS